MSPAQLSFPQEQSRREKLFNLLLSRMPPFVVDYRGAMSEHHHPGSGKTRIVEGREEVVASLPIMS